MDGNNTMTTLLVAISKDLEMAAPDVVTCQQCPALQDIAGEIASVLSRSSGNSMEEIMNDIINVVSLEELHDARAVMFTHAIGVILENDNLENRSPSDFRLKQRRGKKAIANTAMDIVHLFKYLCNGNGEFPTGVLMNNTLPNTPVENAPDSSPIPTPLYDLIALPPSSQDLQCGQPDPGVSSPGLTSARSPSPIGSPFLADEEPMVSRPSVRQSSPRQPINQSFSDNSVVISEVSMISDTDGTPLTRCPPAVCCDHSRAILDLRCTVDTMQHQMIELQRQIDAYGKDKFTGTPVPSPRTDAVQDDDITRPSYVEGILPSPPDSQSPSMDSIDLNQSLSSDSCNFSSIFNIATPTKDSHSNVTHCQQPLVGATVRDRDSAVPDVSDTDPAATPAANVETDPLTLNFGFVQTELDALRTRLMDFEDRIGNSEMRAELYDEAIETVKCLQSSNDTVKETLKSVNVKVENHEKRIKTLSTQVNKAINCNGNGREKIVPNVETSNRFAPLASACTSDSLKPPKRKSKGNNKKGPQAKKAVTEKSGKTKDRTNKRRKVKIIGASMVRGQGRLVTDKRIGISACCFPCPGAKAQHIRKRLPGMVSSDDDAVVVLGGTNNVPVDDVGTCIKKIGGLVQDVHKMNRTAHIIVSEIPNRFDDIALNYKIDKVNVFIRHICTKSKRLHAMSMDHLSRSHFARDGLHFSESGQLCFANAVKETLAQCLSPPR